MRISENNQKVVDEVLQAAMDKGRFTLLEYEVYRILEGVGFDVPKHLFVPEGQPVTESDLKGFSDEVIVKIVSPDIAHKQKVGGVKRIKTYEPLYVQYVLEKMRQEVLSYFPQDGQPRIEGYMIAEVAAFKPGLGYEILLGIKTDSSFGPVVTLSKGGDDAEFFAKYYDKANLVIPHMNYEQALELAGSLKIHNKFVSIGHPEYTEFIAKGVSVISALAYTYSSMNPDNPTFRIKTMDINPFAITTDNRFMAIDGYLEFEYAGGQICTLPQPNTNNLEAFFNPKGIAVIGVSADDQKYSMGREIARLLHDLGREDLYLININGGETQLGGRNYPLYPTLHAVKAEIDLVVYAAPSRTMRGFFECLSSKLPKAVVLIPGIPQDKPYAEFVTELKAVVPAGVRIIGPNCMGVFYGESRSQKGVNTLFINEERLHLKTSRFSNTALLTQSGGMAITLIDQMPNAPIFKSIVSFGNKYDVKITDLVAHFNADEEVKVIALYIEGFAPGEGRAFYELMRSVTKPVIVYKSGRTDAGAKAAASHTAAMTGDYDVFRAACGQGGVMLVEDTKSYMDAIKIFSLLAGKRVGGRRAAGILNAGFEATVAADELGQLMPATISTETQAAFDRINSHGLVDTHTAILDVTPMTTDLMYRDFIEAALKDEGVDCVFIGIVPHVDNIKTTPDTCRDADSLANLIVDLFHRYDKPMVVSVNGGEYFTEFVALMEREGIPVFPDIRSAVKALDCFVKYHFFGLNG